MDTHSAITLARRARKALQHAVRQHAEAKSEAARRRHLRRAMNARRTMGEAQAFYEECLSIEMGD